MFSAFNGEGALEQKTSDFSQTKVFTRAPSVYWGDVSKD